MTGIRKQSSTHTTKAILSQYVGRLQWCQEISENKLSTVKPQDTGPQAARTLTMHVCTFLISKYISKERLDLL